MDSLLRDFWWQGLAWSYTVYIRDPTHSGKYIINLKLAQYSRPKLSGWLLCDSWQFELTFITRKFGILWRQAHKKASYSKQASKVQFQLELSLAQFSPSLFNTIIIMSNKLIQISMWYYPCLCLYLVIQCSSCQNTQLIIVHTVTGTTFSCSGLVGVAWSDFCCRSFSVVSCWSSPAFSDLCWWSISWLRSSVLFCWSCSSLLSVSGLSCSTLVK